jgi:hypothetical protein
MNLFIVYSKRASSLATDARAGNGPTVYDCRAWAEAYLKLLASLTETNTGIMDWIEVNVIRVNPDFDWLRLKLMALGQFKLFVRIFVGSLLILIYVFNFLTAAPEPDMEAALSQKVAIVSGAGIPQINGQYHFSRIHRDSAIFIKPPTMFKNERANFNLYRCKMSTENYCWFISHVHEGKDPGTQSDIDYYSAPSPYNERYKDTNDVLPPVTGWMVVGNHPSNQYNSPPTVRIVDRMAVDGAMMIDTDGGLERAGSMEALDDDDDALDREGGLDTSYNDSLGDDMYGYTPQDESLDQSMDQSID